MRFIVLYNFVSKERDFVFGRSLIKWEKGPKYHNVGSTVNVAKLWASDRHNSCSG